MRAQERGGEQILCPKAVAERIEFHVGQNSVTTDKYRVAARCSLLGAFPDVDNVVRLGRAIRVQTTGGDDLGAKKRNTVMCKTATIAALTVSSSATTPKSCKLQRRISDTLSQKINRTQTAMPCAVSEWKNFLSLELYQST